MSKIWLIVTAVVLVAVLLIVASLLYIQTSRSVSRSFELTYNSSPRWQQSQCMPPSGTLMNISWSATGAETTFQFIIWPSSSVKPLVFDQQSGYTFPVSQGGIYNFSATNMSGPSSFVAVLLQYSTNEALGSGSMVSPPCYG